MYPENQKIKELMKSRDRWKQKAKQYRMRSKNLDNLLRYYRKKKQPADE
jgi:hypothetical protein